MNAILKRLSEPSTWAAVAALLVALGINDAVVGPIIQVAAGLSALAAVAIPERKK